MTRLLIAVLLALTIAEVKSVYAAEITVPAHHMSGKRLVSAILIEGPIEKGDYDKFRKATQSSFYQYPITHVELASSGGNLLEAMKIGSLIRDMRFSTGAPLEIYEGADKYITVKLKNVKNRICSSACFFIWAAGIERSGTELSVHRPYLPIESYLEIGAEDAISGGRKIRELSEKYLKEMDIPNELIARMFKIPSRKVEKIPYNEALSSLGGINPDIEDWVLARCPDLTAEQKLDPGWGKKQIAIDRCRNDAIAQAGCHGWMKEFRKSADTAKAFCKKYF